jgi:hypothetical protein
MPRSVKIVDLNGTPAFQTPTGIGPISEQEIEAAKDLSPSDLRTYVQQHWMASGGRGRGKTEASPLAGVPINEIAEAIAAYPETDDDDDDGDNPVIPVSTGFGGPKK